MAPSSRKPSFSHAGGVVSRTDATGGTGGSARSYLLVRARKDPAHWVLPKGHLEAGETLTEAALREVVEETGFEAEILGYLGETRYELAGEEVHTAWFAMRALPKTQAPAERETQWVTASEAVIRLTFEDARELVRLADAGPAHWTRALPHARPDPS